jgi:hypothetical protein
VEGERKYIKPGISPMSNGIMKPSWEVILPVFIHKKGRVNGLYNPPSHKNAWEKGCPQI